MAISETQLDIKSKKSKAKKWAKRKYNRKQRQKAKLDPENAITKRKFFGFMS